MFGIYISMLCLRFFVRGDDYPQYGSGCDDHEACGWDAAEESKWEKFQIHQYNEDRTVNQVHTHHNALVALLGSEEFVSKSIYRVMFESESYFKLAQVELLVQGASTDPNKVSRLNSTQKREIENVIKILNGRKSELSKISKEPWLLQELLKYRSSLFAVLPSASVFEHLTEILEQVEEEIWNCSYLVIIWQDIVKTYKSTHTMEVTSNFSKKELQRAIWGLAGVAQAVLNVTFGGPFYDEDHKFLQNKAELLNVLTESRILGFDSRAIGTANDAESLVERVLCRRLSLQVLQHVLYCFIPTNNCEDFVGPAMTVFHQPIQVVTRPEDIVTLFKMQNVLRNITSDLTANKDERSPQTKLLGINILDSYMDLVDKTVNIKSTDAWAQMEFHKAKEKLHLMLLNNEQYIGLLSDMIFSTAHSDSVKNLEKDSLSVSMSHMTVHEDRAAIAEFKYDDMLVWTDDLKQHKEMRNTRVNVFALRYKSWSQMMLDIAMKRAHNFSVSAERDTNSKAYTNGAMSATGQRANLTRHTRSVSDTPSITYTKISFNKTFIGKGGVVSLSTHENGQKKSIPVTYWIQFDNETIDYHESSTSHIYNCLSCEYLDAATINWESHGCTVLNASSTGITCRCNHTTNFAAFMMPAETDFVATKEERKILEIMSLAGSSLSVLGLLGSLVVFALVRNLVRNERLKAHVHLSVSLLAVHTLYLLGDVFLRGNVLCIVSTVFSHYFLLSSFMWMFVEGIFLYLYVVQVFLRSRIINYSWMYVVGWVLPAVVVAISAGIGIPNRIYAMPSTKKAAPRCPEGTLLYSRDNRENSTVNDQRFAAEESEYDRCWLSTQSGMIWSFLAPALLVLLFNTFIMAKTIQVCIRSFNASSNFRKTKKTRKVGNSIHPNMPSPRFRYAMEKSSEGQINSDTYDHLHGETNAPHLHGINAVQYSSPPVIISTSPCLLQVTTEEEEDEEKTQGPSGARLLSVPSQETLQMSRVSPSRNNLATPNHEESLQLRSGNTESGRNSPRYPSLKSESNRLVYSRGSAIYRNSPKSSLTSPVISSAGETNIFWYEAKTAVKGAIVLLPVLGLPWVCGVVAHLSKVFAFIFVALNSTQGLAIFVVYCIFNGEVRRALQRRFAVRRMKYAVDAGVRRSSSTSSAPVRGFLRFGRRRSTVTTSG